MTEDNLDLLDRLRVTGLRVWGRHGVYPYEREQGQEFVIDATLFIDTRPAAHTDQVTATVHYGDLARRLSRITEGESVQLIETLAERLVTSCLSDERVKAAEITVHKPAAGRLLFEDVSVTVLRRRLSQ